MNNIKPRNPILKYLGYLLLATAPIMGVYLVFFNPSRKYLIVGLATLGISIYFEIKIIKNKGLGKK